jgi:hypothetical protein
LSRFIVLWLLIYFTITSIKCTLSISVSFFLTKTQSIFVQIPLYYITID